MSTWTPGDPDAEGGELLTDDAEESWVAVSAALAALDEDDLEDFAAGPLEELLWVHGDDLAETLAAAARVDQRLAGSLAMVWIETAELTPATWQLLGEWLRAYDAPSSED